MKERLNEAIAGILVGVVCHTLAFSLFSAILYGLGYYGFNSLYSALQNGVIFGTVFGCIYGLKQVRWYVAGLVEVAVLGGLMAFQVVAQAIADPHYSLAMGGRNLIDMCGSAFIGGALTVLGVEAFKWQFRTLLYPPLRNASRR